jgi:ribonuclease-3
MEALFGAVYLDGGLDAAFSVIYRVLKDHFPTALEERSDYKSRLQIIIQREYNSDLIYELTAQTGTAHQPSFAMCVMYGGRVLGEGRGPSKQAAQQAAARDALSRVKELIRKDCNAP